MSKVTCIGCKKEPEQLSEYRVEAERAGQTPTEWVKENEGVGCWGPHSRDKFWCTACYIKAGQPLRRY
jgi:hypothetical protein